MRSSRVLTLVTGAALLAACGGGDGNGPSNPAPTAAFTSSCTQLVCTFTDASTDVSPGTIASYNWTFGDGPTPITTQNATHTYTAAGTYAVTLTVTDNGGEDNALTQQVTVTATAQNQAPVANFTSICNSLNCTFTNTSTDDGTFTSIWDFGDGSADSDNLSPTHTYTNTTLTDYTVTLTVTDDDGVTAQQTAVISVSPPATLTCGATPNCSLAIDQPATVTVTLVSSSCQLANNTFRVTITPPGGGTPVEETLFTDGCNQTTNPPGTAFPLQSGAVIASGTTITAQVISGGATLEIDPAIRVTGSFATGWTLEFDDGAKAGPPPEPDFDDLIISIVATP